MGHYEERLESDLTRLRATVSEMAEKVEAGVKNAMHALRTGDRELAAGTVLRDHEINRAMRRIDKLCHAFSAQHLPSAGHLRLLSSVMRVNIELERIGDYAVTIAREALQLSAPPSGPLVRELERVGDETQIMLRQAVQAFEELNADTARATMVMEERMENDLDLVYAELMANDDHDAVKNLLKIFSVFTQLKRVADQAKNVCEETVFAVTGETKAPKVYNILFVDEDDSCLSQMAVAIARKRFPVSGSYSSAGLRPAAALNAATVAFLEGHGVPVEAERPQALDPDPLALRQRHVVVSMQGPLLSYFAEIPFHTTPLEWEIGAPPSDGSAFEAWLEEAYRDIATHVRELMEQLSGEDPP